jgi:hypothetical protein
VAKAFKAGVADVIDGGFISNEVCDGAPGAGSIADATGPVAVGALEAMTGRALGRAA